MPPTPEDWAARLQAQLTKQAQHARTHDDIYTGKRRLAIVEREYRDIFGTEATTANLLALTPPDTGVAAVGVDALRERLQIESFTAVSGFGEASDAGRVQAAATALWDGSDMDVMHSVAITEALIKGRSYLQLGLGPDGATLSVEDPEQMAVVRDHAPPYDVKAAMKVSDDPWGGGQVRTLWLPGQRFTGRQQSGGWSLDSGVPAEERVPVYELAYRQRLIAEPTSYIAPIASLADSYALLMAYLVIAARFGAVPLLTMSGVALPRDLLTGQPLPFGSDPTRPDLPPRPVGATEALATENPAGKFGRIEAGQLAGYIGALEMLLGSIMALTRAPASYYGLGAKSGTSGETVKASESGLERRKVDVQRYLGATIRRATSDAVSADLGRRVQVTPRWANTETHIEAQDADAVQKYVAAGLPLRSVLERIGFPAAFIDQALSLAKEDKKEADFVLSALAARTGAGGAAAPPVVPAPPAAG